MRLWHRAAVFLRSWLKPGQMDTEFGEELAFHVDQQTEANLQKGMSCAEARRLARLSVGAPGPLQELSRASRPGAWCREFLRDAIHAARALRRAPGFAASAVLIVALAVAATTTIFTLVYGIALRPLPFREPDRLMTIWLDVPQSGASRVLVSAADRDDWQSATRSFGEIALLRTPANFNLTGVGEPERLLGALVSPGLFDVLGVQPVLGRSFAPDEASKGADRVVVLSDGLWKRRFGSDRQIIGRDILLDGRPHTVIGVMSDAFSFPNRDIQLWRPLIIDPDELTTRIGNNYVAVARLAGGTTLGQAREELELIARQLDRRFPVTNELQIPRVTPLSDDYTRDVRGTLFLLTATVILLLVVACLNLGCLIAVRTIARAREFLVRLALGASRKRLLLQSAAEVAPVTIAGAALGVAVTIAAVAALASASTEIPRIDEIRVNVPVLLVAVATLSFIGLIAALVPTLYFWRADAGAARHDEGRTSSLGRRHTRVHAILVITQLALVLPLLIGASLLTRSLVALTRVDTGFSRDHVLTLHIAIPRQKYPGDRDVAEFSRRLVERVAALPGVEAAAMVNRLPLAGVGQVTPLEFERAADPPVRIFTDTRSVTPAYFQTMRIPVREGRAFDERDNHLLLLAQGPSDPSPVVIIDERIAQAVWPGQSPIGRRARVPIGNAPWMAIVGVVGHIRHDGLDVDPRPQVYFNYLERVQDRMALVVKGRRDVTSLAPSVRQAIHDIDADQPVYDVRTMDDVVDRTMSHRRLNLLVVALFASAALTLASLGVYGVVAYSVGERRREFGIRLTLGARRADVVRAVIGRGLALTGGGLVLGLVGAAAATRAMQSQLFGVSATDVVSIVVAVGVLLTMSIVASYVPARRAASVDPAVVLRNE